MELLSYCVHQCDILPLESVTFGPQNSSLAHNLKTPMPVTKDPCCNYCLNLTFFGIPVALTLYLATMIINFVCVYHLKT